MKHRFFYRFVLVLTALAVMVLALPHDVFAAGPTISIVSVKADDSVTIRAANFPANTRFTARMDVAGNAAVNGIVIAELNSGAGGTFEATFKIPAELKGKPTLAIRLEAANNAYFAYDWFNNKTTTASSTPVPVTGTGNTAVSPYIKVVAVDEDNKITISATGMPANINFNVRVGPYFSFARENVTVVTINSGKGGAFEFNVDLPDMVDGEDWVTVRMDQVGGGYYVYNAFRNQDQGTVSTNPNTPTAAPSTAACTITKTSPTGDMPTRYDFDAVWEVKNTSGKTWEMGDVDYKFVSGEKIYIHDARYDLPKTVKNGESITIRVDMLSPSTTGWFTTNWALVSGSKTLCALPLTIHVK